MEAEAPAFVESPLKYHPCVAWCLIWKRKQCLLGSLTGVVASKNVSEAFKGPLNPLGNRMQSAIAEAGLTVGLTRRAGSKDGYSDPVVPHGRAIAQRIKGTPGITG